MKTLGKDMVAWIAPIICMFRYHRSNGIVEGFHRKMKLIQGRAYGFRNFENYRLQARVLVIAFRGGIVVMYSAILDAGRDTLGDIGIWACLSKSLFPLEDKALIV